MVKEGYKYVMNMVMKRGERREWQCWNMAMYMARIEREVLVIIMKSLQDCT
jgi:hypothetical protein